MRDLGLQTRAWIINSRINHTVTDVEVSLKTIQGIELTEWKSDVYGNETYCEITIHISFIDTSLFLYVLLHSYVRKQPLRFVFKHICITFIKLTFPASGTLHVMKTYTNMYNSTRGSSSLCVRTYVGQRSVRSG